MYSYNSHLLELRRKSGLSLKEAANKIGLSRFSLYLYENGYFRPSKKSLKKLEDFYQEKISINGLDAYPTPVHEKYNIKKEKKPLFIKRVVFGGLALLMLTSSITGAVLFNKAVNNEESYYGDIYNRLKDEVKKDGKVGYDLVTSLEYYSQDYIDALSSAIINFYKKDSLLYFNECIYSETHYHHDLGSGRYYFTFGSNLGVSSYKCSFSYAGFLDGTFFTSTFTYEGKEITELDSFDIRVDGHNKLSKELAIALINERIGYAEHMLSKLISNELGEELSFYNDFLAAREKGRIVNFNLQIAGLSLILTGVFFFFIFFGVFVRLMIVHIKPRLVVSKNDIEALGEKDLPEDLDVKFGVPDTFIKIFAKLVSVSSIVLMLVGLLTNLGILSLPSFFGSDEFAAFLRKSLVAGVFLAQFVALVRLKRPEALLKTIIYNLFLFLFIATLETVIISITNEWGYNLGSIIYSYIPGNIFEIVAIHYIIFLFLFFEPPFLNKRKKYVRYLWHSLSFIPLAFLVFTYFMSNSYALTYGIKEDIFVNFWFPNGALALSIVSVLFMYSVFVLRLLLVKKYGERNAQIFFYGDRYNLIENSVACFYLLLIGLIDLAFVHNQVGFYLGLGSNQWIFILIPFIIICKYSPNNQQTVLLEKEEFVLSRERDL